MVTVVNNPPSNNSGGPIGMIILLVIVLVLGYFAYIYGLPAVRQMQSGSPQINVPSQIDINVKQTQ
jgi:hypothetical protein